MTQVGVKRHAFVDNLKKSFETSSISFGKLMGSVQIFYI